MCIAQMGDAAHRPDTPVEIAATDASLCMAKPFALLMADTERLIPQGKLVDILN